MKKISMFLMLFVIVSVQAQNYKISFAGKSASTKVDSVKVKNLTQCTDISLSGSDTLNLLKVITGINEINNSTDNTLQIYPNPMTGYCLIEFEATAQGETNLELYDIAGKRITRVQDLLMKGEHKYSLSGIASGIYVLKVESNQYAYSAKIVSTNSTSGIAEIKLMETVPASSFQSPASNIKAMKSLKSNKLIDMQYNTNDTLKLTGFSAGKYATVSMLVPAKSQTDTFNFIKCTDADSNHYTVVKIGTQWWMAENLKTTSDTDGTAIPLVTVDSIWAKLTTPGYCWYNNDSATYSSTYGALYNWYADSTGKLCPSGWHVPSISEWTTLITYLGGDNIAGGKMKDTCSTYWDSPNKGATNSSGFTALSGGIRYNNGPFYYLGNWGEWGSATEYNATSAWDFFLAYDSPNAWVNEVDYKNFGFSVRCVKNKN